MVKLYQGQISRKRIEQALPGTFADVLRRSGLGITTVRNNLRDMRKERLIYVSKWLRSEGKGSFQPFFRRGRGKDVPCELVAFTSKEKTDRFKSRRIADGTWEDKKILANSRLAIKRTIKKGDPLVSALFGR